MNEVRDDPKLQFARSAFSVAHERLLELIEYFRANADFFQQATYSEAQARKDFIDPLLKALGWDVDHEREHNPYEQEVKVERSLTIGAARAQKRADYAFYLAPNFRDPRFFVEAKKPSVDLTHSADAHFQIWRYGYSANTPLAVLTDFEQVRVLDCRARPQPEGALDRVWKHWHYSDFRDPEKFAGFYWLFSREAHADGSFQRRVEELPKPRGGTRQRGLFRGDYRPVDESFLAELEEHREALAKAFKKADHALGSEALTAIVQRTLDRLVFLRFLEDKQIETDIRVSDFGRSGSAWRDFITASRRLDNIYNGIVFKREPPLDDAAFAPDDEVFASLCEQLAAENSPYNFDAIPIHILGSIYERFLGSVIRATAERVVIEEKPEVRKVGGVYYTPEYIVRYIVAQAVGKLIEGKSPARIAKLRFADIACGSGSFLLGVFDELLRYHAEWYNRPEREKAAKRDKCVRGEDGRWRLSLAQRRAILLNNIYGVDIDRQAVEVAQLSLFLKLLEDERAVSARQHQLDYARDPNLKKLLPDLSHNIMCGNSLVGWDIVDLAGLSAEDERKLNPLDFADAFKDLMHNGGFDAIVGNPPYVDSEWMTKHLLLTRHYCSAHYEAAAGNWDIFCVFVERAIALCKPNGRTSLIVPNKLGSANYAADARKVIACNSLVSLRDYSDVPVFPVAVYPIVYMVEKKHAARDATVLFEKMAPDEKEVARVIHSANLGLGAYFTPPKSPWRVFASLDGTSVLERVDRFPRLLEIATVVGAATVAEAYEIATLLEEGGDGIRVVNSGTVDPYALLWGHKQFRYLGQSYLRPTVPKSKRKMLPSRRLEQATTPKIIVAGMTKRIECALDSDGAYLAGKSTSLVLWAGDLRYLVAILNSRLVNFFYNAQFGGDKLQGGYLRIGPPQLKTIPIPPIEDKADRSRHDQIVRLVVRMLEAKKHESAANGHAKEVATRKCAALDHRINALVYELYNLTQEEIALVERSSS